MHESVKPENVVPISVGIKRAVEITRERGLKVGAVVGHPSDDIAYELKEINGDKAVVWITGKIETMKTFPLDELYDPHIAMEQALLEKQKSIFESQNN